MSSKRILGIAGAAIVGTLAGTGVVHAEISIGDSGTTGVAVFAKETFVGDRNIPPRDGRGGPYYEASAHTGNSREVLDLNVPLGISVPTSSDAIVTIDLENLVLTGTPTPSLIVSPSVIAATPANITGLVAPTIRTGGTRGDRRVQFGFSTTSTAAAADSRLLVTLGRLGVDLNNPGNITVTSSYTFAGERIVDSTVLTGAVMAAEALSVKATPQMQTASVEDGFLKFKSEAGSSGVAEDRLSANVGKLEIGIATTTPPTTFLDAGRGDVSSGGEVTAASHIASDAVIAFLGDTSFVATDEDGKKEVYVSTDETCPSGASIEDADDATKLEAALDDFDDAGGAYLCLKADGETAIPVTEPYTVNISYTSILGTNAASPPEASTEELGSIDRDGSTVRIAYLTTNRKYNQRLVVVNRTSAPVSYSMTFQTQEGVTANAGDGASGTFPAGRTVMDVRDIVTFDNGGNGSHGSAELAAVVARGSLDVATVTTTIADGSTDTVVWDTMSQ